MPKHYMGYSEQALDDAVKAVSSGETSVRRAAAYYGVPKSTLSDHITGKSQSGVRPGRRPTIPEKLENAMVSNAMEAAERGFGISRTQFMIKAHQVCTKFNITNNFRGGVPGKDWFAGVKRRHPELTLRKPEQLTTSRARLMNPTVVHRYFADLGTVLSSVEHKPELIWNMDETGFQLQHHPVNVVARKGCRSIPGRTSNSRESITVVASVNAAGTSMPPLIIGKGKTSKSLRSFSTDQAPPGTVWTYQSKAWMEDVLGEEWFQNIFLANCGTERPQVLILDSHSSHETLGLLEKAKLEQIHVLAIPPHTSHFLQPLDRTVFGPLSKNYNKVCSLFMSSSPNNIVNKSSWPQLFNQAWQRACTEQNISNGFKSCGIHPFNPYAISLSAFAPSHPFDVPQPTNQQTNSNSSLTHSGHNEQEQQTSQTISVLLPHPDTYEHPSSFIIDLQAHSPNDIPPTLAQPTITTLSSDADISSGEHINSETSLSANWNTNLESIFAIPQADRKATHSRALKSHRLLTSDDILAAKRIAYQEKQKKNDLKNRKRSTKTTIEQ